MGLLFYYSLHGYRTDEMVSTESEISEYNSDFEEISEDGHVRERSSSTEFSESFTQMVLLKDVDVPIRPMSRASNGGERRLPWCSTEEGRSRSKTSEDSPDISNGVSGRRPLRARISVQPSRHDDERRFGSGDSGFSQGGSYALSNSRPMWLQHEGSMPQVLHREPRLSVEACLGLKSGDQVPRTRESGPRTPGVADPIDDGSVGGEERKVKRLQQEIQRLSQRLKEAELLSIQDDGVPTFNLNEIEIGCQVAQGGFSSVCTATWRCTECAVKKIFDPVITEELRAEFDNEVRMLRRLRHPHVVTLMAVCRTPPALSILTEYLGGGTLFELLHSGPSLKPADCPDCEPSTLLPVVLQTGVALAYLHGMLVVHRDVKSNNVLLTLGPRPTAKLCDFGLARMKSELCTGTMQWAGTAAYMAPELFARKRYTEAIDVFAFGVLLWEAASTELPHANLESADIASRVMRRDGAGLTVTHTWPKSLKDLLHLTLAVKPELRPLMFSVVDQLRSVLLDFPAVERD